MIDLKHNVLRLEGASGEEVVPFLSERVTMFPGICIVAVASIAWNVLDAGYSQARRVS
jgi:hypothetical protein